MVFDWWEIMKLDRSKSIRLSISMAICLAMSAIMSLCSQNAVVMLTFDRLLPQTDMSKLVEQVVALWSDIALLHNSQEYDQEDREQLADMIIGKLTRLYHSIVNLQSDEETKLVYISPEKAEYLLSIFYQIGREHSQKKCRGQQSCETFELIGNFISTIEDALLDVLDEK